MKCKKPCGKLLDKYFSSVCRGPQLSSSNHRISHSLPQTEISALTLDCCCFNLTAKTISLVPPHRVFRADNGIADNYIGPTGTSGKTAIRGCWEQNITEMDESAVGSDGCFSFAKLLWKFNSLFVRVYWEQMDSSLRVEELHCKTHRLALQGLWSDALRRDAGCDGSPVSCVAILWQRDEKPINL